MKHLIILALALALTACGGARSFYKMEAAAKLNEYCQAGNVQACAELTRMEALDRVGRL